MQLCMGNAERAHENFPQSGRGLSHVTFTIFGSTVGYLATAWLLVIQWQAISITWN